MESCPSDEQLAVFAEGVSDEQERASIQAHLRNCERCARWLKEAEASEEIASVVRAAVGTSFSTATEEDQANTSSPLSNTATVPMRSEPSLPSIPGYRLAGEIHRGGQGDHLRGHPGLDRPASGHQGHARGALRQPAGSARFEREVRVLAQLKHSNIVAIHDSGESAGHFYFVMDYIEGERLDDAVKSRSLAIDKVLQLFARVGETVNAAHLRGVIHRDLKPSNILVDQDGEPHILDFGLAKLADDVAQAPAVSVTGEFMGSVPWASPEQADGTPNLIDLRTDVYSLGVMLYRMLVGRYPYDVSGSVHTALGNILKRRTNQAKYAAKRDR